MIFFDEQLAGSILSHRSFGEPEVTYQLGKEFWGKGIATEALRLFLNVETTRPLFGRVVKGQRRVTSCADKMWGCQNRAKIKVLQMRGGQRWMN